MAIASVQAVTSLALPELAPYRTMRMQADHWRQRIFVAEGEKVVRRLLESPLGVVSVLVPEKWLRVLEPLTAAHPSAIQVFTAEKKVLEQLTGFSMYQGLLAVGRIPPPVSVTGALATAPSPRLFAAVDALSSAENIGALVRNCVAFGVQALLVGETSSHPYLRRAVRSSMGTVFQLPVIEAADLVASLRELRAAGMRCVAAHPHTDGRTVTQARLNTNACLVFGSEGYGLSPAVLAGCDDAVAVPMPPTVDSLNVASAAAIFLYEANRQRGKM